MITVVSWPMKCDCVCLGFHCPPVFFGFFFVDFSLSNCTSVHLLIRLIVRPSMICLSFCLSVHLSLCSFVSHSICIRLSLPICLCISCVSICRSANLSLLFSRPQFSSTTFPHVHRIAVIAHLIGNSTLRILRVDSRSSLEEPSCLSKSRIKSPESCSLNAPSKNIQV